MLAPQQRLAIDRHRRLKVPNNQPGQLLLTPAKTWPKTKAPDAKLFSERIKDRSTQIAKQTAVPD